MSLYIGSGEKLKVTVVKEVVAQDTLDATARPKDILADKTAYANGVKMTGTIPIKTSADSVVSGATVTVPAGYYADPFTKSVDGAPRAETTINSDANETHGFITMTASNNQGTGYVTGENKTASRNVFLAVDGPTASMTDGNSIITRSVETVERADTIVTASGATGESNVINITASNDQATGYVTGSNSTTTKRVSLSASGDTVSASVDGVPYASQSVATATHDEPTINVNSSTGVVTAGHTQGAGYVSSDYKTKTLQLPPQPGTTITPTTYDRFAVYSGFYTTGDVKVKGDANLVAENIKSGVSIFGVTGTHAGGSYELYGGQIMYPEEIADRYIPEGSYSTVINFAEDNVWGWFYDGQCFNNEQISRIAFGADGSINIMNDNVTCFLRFYPSKGWMYSNGMTELSDFPDERYRIMDFKNAKTLSQEEYQLMIGIIANNMDDTTPYYIGYGVGYREGYDEGSIDGRDYGYQEGFDDGYDRGYAEGGGGSSADLEALGVLCDWQILGDTGNSDSMVYIFNYHPSYYLRCNIFYPSGNVMSAVVAPNSGESVFVQETIASWDTIEIQDVRWTASAT